MALLPSDNRLKLEKMIEDEKIESDLRGYLGISSIGDPCPRKLWYSFRQCFREKITARQARLFQRGHREEPIIQTDLRKIGIICNVDQDNQPEVITGHGHIKGHFDDLLDNVREAPKTRHLGEYKTANDKSFKDTKKRGVKASKPLYYDQMVCYMYLEKLTRALFIMVNKNDDSRHYERVKADTSRAKQLIKRGIDIISTETPPQKIGGPDWYYCKWCGAYDICQFHKPIIKTSRTCQNVAICDNGKWECDLYGINLTFPQQIQACKKYKKFNSL